MTSPQMPLARARGAAPAAAASPPRVPVNAWDRSTPMGTHDVPETFRVKGLHLTDHFVSVRRAHSLARSSSSLPSVRRSLARLITLL